MRVCKPKGGVHIEPRGREEVGRRDWTVRSWMRLLGKGTGHGSFGLQRARE